MARTRILWHIISTTVITLVVSAGMALAPAQAQVSCSATSTTINFGDINPFGTANLTLGGSVTANCSNSSSTPITTVMCLEVGAGSGGTYGADRAISTTSLQQLPIQIYSPAGAPTQVGDGLSWPYAGPRSISLPAGGSASVTFPFSIVLLAPHSISPNPGTFSSSFSGPGFNLFGSLSGQTTCTMISGADRFNASGTLTVQARVLATCTVAATPLDFGTRSLITSPLTTTATLTLRCNAAIPVAVGINDGTVGGGTTGRRMESAAGRRVIYDIFRNAAFSQRWGDDIGRDTLSVSAAAGTTSVTVYGRVPVQAAPTPGVYRDTVIVTATY